MFTGIVEELGAIRGINAGGRWAKLDIEAKVVLEKTKLGDSIAVNGVCLTVTSLGTNRFTADVMDETLKKTSLRELKSGSKVNLERALRVGDPMGGHMVSGHVDGVGKIIRQEKVDIALITWVQCSASISNQLIPKGSVAIDGISLTVVDVEAESFSVSLIPHTVGMTTLGFKKAGDQVNLETDVLGKYVQQYVRHFLNAGKQSEAAKQPAKISMEFLRENGF